MAMAFPRGGREASYERDKMLFFFAINPNLETGS